MKRNRLWLGAGVVALAFLAGPSLGIDGSTILWGCSSWPVRSCTSSASTATAGTARAATGMASPGASSPKRRPGRSRGATRPEAWISSATGTFS
jgi:hypothetical protein